MTFTKDSKTGLYIAEETVTKDFNIHLEVEGYAKVAVGISTTSAGKKVTVYNETINGVMDRDFSAVIYPKYVKISCSAVPKSSAITKAV